MSSDEIIRAWTGTTKAIEPPGPNLFSGGRSWLQASDADRLAPVLNGFTGGAGSAWRRDRRRGMGRAAIRALNVMLVDSPRESFLDGAQRAHC